MSVIAIFLWECEQCSDHVIKSEGISPYSDPVAIPPEGWDYLNDGNTYVCPKCKAAEPKE